MDILKDFGVEPILLIAQVVNFVILLILLKRFLYKPILKVLEERKKKIETSVKQSEEIQKRFEETAQKQAEILDKAKVESEQIIEGAKNEAKILADQIQLDAANAANETIKRTQQSFEIEKQKMIIEAKREIVDIVTAATEKVVQKNLTKQDKERLIKQALTEIKE
ncbi:MAG: ATP synthase F0 subunit B [Candidatus Woykebacteria bacterium RBG_16_44_10]|uniref:ATP synthase subunit b n=1 Tax=Candidatus Woykebacteria bacterium RBG_16_44_10 TaxID=1802597 RepID=A0A1G1WEQ6_9BACT|nr:MAG: ATP synthase F0 subunit B [Candidatus Woykebacteria bacterium RBG_16_44_10]